MDDTFHSPYAALTGLDYAELANEEMLSSHRRIEPFVARHEFGGFIGTSPAMQSVYDQIERAARSLAPVFITGESGTGKEICAEAIHKYSTRADKPFIAINCAAIPEDLIESELFGHVKGAFTGAIHDRDGAATLANGGTLFLDEICEMSVHIQSKLLRFLQDFSFMKVGSTKAEKTDVRLICATNRNPRIDIGEGRFREDLYYRMHVLPLHMPPLRERGDDILDLAYALLKKYALIENKEFAQFSVDAEMVLRHYPWPGNIRELQNVIRQVVVMADGTVVTPGMLPEHVCLKITRLQKPNSSTPHRPEDARIMPLWLMEKNLIEQAIELCHGNIPRAAAILEISPSTIYRKKLSWENGLPGAQIYETGQHRSGDR